MFRSFLLFLVFLSQVILFSQDLTEPLPVRSNLLAHAQLIPENLQLFTQDTVSQILFNPARAVNYGKSFLFVNYLPSHNYEIPWYPIQIPWNSTSSSTFNPYDYYGSYLQVPSFSLVSLFNCAGGKWLLTIDNSISRNNNEYSANHPEDLYYIDNESKARHSIAYNTSAKFSFIGQSAWSNFSVGLFFNTNSLTDNQFNLSQNKSFNIYNSSEDFYQSHTYINDLTSRVEGNQKKYNLGLELGLNKGSLDYRGRVSYQDASNIFNETYISENFSADSTRNNNTWSIQSYKNRNINIESSDSKPYSISMENYFSYKLGVISSEDHIFLSANAYYSKGDNSSSASYLSTYFEYDTSLTYQGAIQNKSAINDWGADLSTGYVFRKTFSDLFILSGLNVYGSYRKKQDRYINSNAVNTVPSDYIKIDNKYYSATFVLPVYVNYSPATWVSVIGGLNFYYTYGENQQLKTSQPLVIGQPSNLIYTTKSSSTSLVSHNENFIGLVLRHPEGFQTQIAFNQDFSSTQYWNISVGYVF